SLAMRCSVFRAAFAFTLLATTACLAAEKSLERQIENFSLRDYRGKVHALDDLRDSKLIVAVFLGTECPLAKLYAPRLEELSKKYASQGVAFVGVDANRQDSITELAAFARVHGVEFPLLVDAGNKIADTFAAARTPEVFVLDGNRKIRYHGRIDDQYGQGAS